MQRSNVPELLQINVLLDVCDLELENVDCNDNPYICIIQEKEKIRNLLDKNHSNVSKTAAELSCTRTAHRCSI